MPCFLMEAAPRTCTCHRSIATATSCRLARCWQCSSEPEAQADNNSRRTRTVLLRTLFGGAVKRAAVRRPTLCHRLDLCRLPRGCEQAFEPPRLGTKVLIGHAYLCAKFRGGMPWPARIEEDRARQRDQVGI